MTTDRHTLTGGSQRDYTTNYRDAMHLGDPGASRHAMEIAARIAISSRGQAPTVEALRTKFGMSRATAYRWRRAFLDALGEAGRVG